MKTIHVDMMADNLSGENYSDLVEEKENNM